MNIPVLKLSENPSLSEILDFKKATTNYPILEMRNKFGMLLGIGTSIKAFQDLKSKKGEYLYSTETKSVVKYDQIVSWIHQDTIIKPYSPQTFFQVKEEHLKAFQNSENFWKENLEKFEKSNSIKKECPDILIKGF
jgi:hypothetical protein